jgi:hypothetical protein
MARELNYIRSYHYHILPDWVFYKHEPDYDILLGEYIIFCYRIKDLELWSDAK